MLVMLAAVGAARRLHAHVGDVSFERRAAFVMATASAAVSHREDARAEAGHGPEREKPDQQFASHVHVSLPFP